MGKDTKTVRDPSGATDIDLPPTTAPTDAPATLGRFRIDAALGHGGMADVYRAYDPVLERSVALKVLRTRGLSDEDQQRRRLLREARAAAALTHPNTATIFEVGEADGEVFLAMELLEGNVLREVIARRDAPLASKLKWLLEAARALAAAHERGLVHRDVKPDNMFVCADGTLKLLDFGIAKRSEEEAAIEREAIGPSSLRTAGGVRAGTPRYMAPEQRAGAPTDARTDEYAWGLVAFELLTGMHLLGGLETAAANGPDAESGPGGATFARLLRDHAPDVPEDVARVVDRALQIQKSERFPTMAPIVLALERSVALPSATTTGPVAVARPPARRRWTIATAAVITVAIGGGAAWRAKAAPLPPACRVDAVRAVPLKVADRFTVLPGGATVIARAGPNDVDRPHLEHDVSGAFAPLSPLGDADYFDPHLHGIAIGDKPALFFQADQRASGTVLALWRPDQKTFDGVQSIQRIFGPLVEAAAIGLGDNNALAVTTGHDDGPEWAVRTWVLLGPPGHVVVERVRAEAPAIAANKERIAIAFATEDAMRVIFVNRVGARMGDTLTVAPVHSRPALAFAGDALVVHWIDSRPGKTRLRVAMLAPGAKAFDAPRDAIDEPVADIRPVAGRLGSGAWALAWIAAPGGNQIVRVSPIGARGELTGPTDAATVGEVRALDVATSGSGIDLAWADAAKESLHVARIGCDAR